MFVAALGLGICGDASAQTADEFYEKGLKAMLDGDFATGCPALEQSYDLDHSLGALFTVAACYARWGKTYTALLRYETFLAEQGQQDMSKLPADKRAKAEERMKNAIAKLKELESQVPTITVKLSAADPSATLTIDDNPAEVAVPVRVDPGDHTLVLMAKGERTERIESVAVGDARTVVLQVGTPVVEPPPPAEDEGEALDPMLIGAIVAGGVGVVGIVVGAVTGAMVFAKKSDVEDNCDDKTCTPEGKEAADDAQTLGLVSTIGFGVGIAGLAAGTVLFLLRDDGEDADSTAGLHLVGGAGADGGFVGVRGAW